MTMMVHLIIKHLIVQRCGGISYRTDTAYIMYKTLKIIGLQQIFFSKSLQGR